ncbi:Hypothetical protein IALB_1140 [Ignavibacterium album JCM 16511]|uniref:Secretion system C-terminal sorting domain-containing protein n=1 Tax=Ignavibacterium album (strain DSM 19864 / JCM 16511 / NBRC 101810 / Mat9-16) TaxID=945713 RepID=I0AIP4_IGNAJ|nr:T9SS type A sorting domain-containing protein [Ignavibacterium album]AFH48851.1 Hypothetical protein IALB_1140 [Ignavibacterium album JCM 16511]
MKNFSILVLFFVLLSSFLFAQSYQWQLKQSGSSLGGPIDVEKFNTNNVYYGSGNKIYRSTDRGETFTQMGTNIPGASSVKSVTLKDDAPGTMVVAVESSPNDKIYKTTDYGQTWTLTNDEGQMSYFGIPVTQDPSHPDTLFTMIGVNFKMSTDFGSTWTTISSNFGPSNAPCDIEVFPDTNIILIGDNGTGIFRSTNYGLSWTQVFSTSGEIPTIAVDFTNPGIAWATKWGGGGGFLKSTDYGLTWVAQPSFAGVNMWGVHTNPNDGNEVFAGCYSCGSTWRTKNGGSTWLQIPISSSHYQVYITDSMSVYAAQSSGLYKLTSPFFIPVELESFIAHVIENKVYLEWITATELNNSGFEIQHSTDNQSYNKVAFVPGFGTTTEKHNYSYTVENLTKGIHYFRLKQIDYDGTETLTNAVEISIENYFIKDFSLEQNYPNPFNPVTNIKYAIPSGQLVQLKVFDLLGNEVATLVNQYQDAGSYQVKFESDKYNLPSGIYIYKLQTGDFISTRKLSLIK